MITAINGHLGQTKRDIGRPIWYRSFGEILKHMKRTPISGLMGDPKFSQNYAKRLETVPC